MLISQYWLLRVNIHSKSLEFLNHLVHWLTSSKQVDTLICHTTMRRNSINFLYNAGYMTLWCLEVVPVVYTRVFYVHSLQLYRQQLECPHSTLPFFASVSWIFRFLDYFQLVARCIVHTCARRSYIMSSAHIIGPKWQCYSGRHSSCWQYESAMNEDAWAWLFTCCLGTLPI